jgi:hypothetical protein
MTRAHANNAAPRDSSTRNVRIVVEPDGSSQKTSASGAITSQAATSDAREEKMVREAEERGKRSGNAWRARKRAEAAVAAGRAPGRPGRPAKPCILCGERHPGAPCPPEALERKLRDLVAARGGAR